MNEWKGSNLWNLLLRYNLLVCKNVKLLVHTNKAWQPLPLSPPSSFLPSFTARNLPCYCGCWCIWYGIFHSQETLSNISPPLTLYIPCIIEEQNFSQLFHVIITKLVIFIFIFECQSWFTKSLISPPRRENAIQTAACVCLGMFELCQKWTENGVCTTRREGDMFTQSWYKRHKGMCIPHLHPSSFLSAPLFFVVSPFAKVPANFARFHSDEYRTARKIKTTVAWRR